MLRGVATALVTIALLAPTASGAEKLDPIRIGQAARTRATVTDDGVVRIGWARTDVAVSVDGVPLKPFAGLGSWAAFTPTSGDAMVMGDTVVFEDEVDAAMDAAFIHGLEVTALHNHFFFDQPKVYFMHIGGHGDSHDLAAGVAATWDAIKAVRAAAPTPARGFPGKSPTVQGIVGSAVIVNALGRTPMVKDGVAKVSIGRSGKMGGTPVAGSMGLTTWIAFSGSDELAVADGDVIMTAEEVQPVLRALRRGGFHVVALHNHMVGDEPAFYFTHFWGKGPAIDLATAFRSVLDAQGRVATAPEPGETAETAQTSASVSFEEPGIGEPALHSEPGETAETAQASASVSFEEPVTGEPAPHSEPGETAETAQTSATVSFEESHTDEPAPRFAYTLTGEGKPGSWVVRDDPTAPSPKRVLAQTSNDQTNYRFPVAVYEPFRAADVDVRVKFKPISGTVDQSGGIVWRYQDKDNYYVVRANALENNVVLYKVEQGERIDLKPEGSWSLAYGKVVNVPAGEWSELRLVARGPRFEVLVNGRHLFVVVDATFVAPGRVGLWTKADSVTAFDDFAVDALDVVVRTP